MSLRASLTRRLAGTPPRPSYAIAGARPAPSWLTAPQALVGRDRAGEPVPVPPEVPRYVPPQQAWSHAADAHAAHAHAAHADEAADAVGSGGWSGGSGGSWPAQVFDDRASPDMLAAQGSAWPESRIDVAASSPGVLIRSPRRPAAIAPEAMPAPLPSVPACVRYTRTPDTILQERRQRALDAEREALARAAAEAQAAQRAVEAEREAERAAALRAAEEEAAAAAAAASVPSEPLPLWRQPFVAPPGVRFFRTPDRRPARPAEIVVEASTAVAALPAAPAEERDWSDLPDWSAVKPWFDNQDWTSAEVWAAIQAEAAASSESALAASTLSEAAPTLAASAVPVSRFVSMPLDISHLRSLPPNPVYVLERLVRFENVQTPRPANAPESGESTSVPVPVEPAVPAAPVRPTLSLIFGPGTPPAAAPAPVVQRPAVSAMAARAAIRPARPQAEPEAAASAPEPRPVPPAATGPAVSVRPAAQPIAPRPVLLRTKPSPEAVRPGEPDAQSAAEVASEPQPEPVLDLEAETVPAGAPSPAPALPVVAPRAILPEPRSHLIPAGRHLPVAVFENADYAYPSLELLALPEESASEEVDADVLEQNALNLQQTVQDFGVRGDILAVRPGPVVTLYELEPAPGTKSSRVIGLSDDIARSMSAVSARVAVVPGRNVIGIELPNEVRETVYLRELLSAPDFCESKHKLALCLGKNIGGEPIIADLARMPHLLVAGTTGSGKSVAINTMILSLLYRLKPEECRLIMVDPKMLELSVYDGIPHLLSPVVIDPKKAVIALKWAVREMEERYKKMSKIGVRNIDGYNARMAEARGKGEVILRTVPAGFDRETGEAVYEQEEMDLSALPYIVIVVDEMADLMMVAGKEIEGAIQRLAQMARAAGIHLIMATQRPSVDVITGTIKANFPTRISFQVTSKIDSRTILGEMGAEQLLGQGDMLFMAGGGRTTRVHGPFCSDSEVESVVAHLKRQGRPAYLDAVTADDGSGEAEKPTRGSKADKAERAERAEAEEEADVAVFDVGSFVASGGGEAGGDLYEQAIQVVLRDKKASTSYIQRRLQIGYNRAASIMERMEIEGIVGPANHAGKREILVEGGHHAASGVMYDDD
ncbi:DNA translocase FtsK [Methylobacterium durans]|nr:DNA translocase FtsK [Methylobacterium durans]